MPSSYNLSEDDRRQLYEILDALFETALPKFEEHRRRSLPVETLPDLAWNQNEGFLSQPDELQIVILGYIMQNIDMLLEDIVSNNHELPLPPEADKEQIRSWKFHIEDDFFIVDRNNEGFVFSQVGLMDGSQEKSNSDRALTAEQDTHEPRLFLVKGHGPGYFDMEEIVSKAATDFARQHPEITPAYQDKYQICLAHTILIPFKEQITLLPMIGPEVCSHYRFSRDRKKAVRTAIKAYEESSLKENTSGVPLYRSLDPVADSNIQRLASGMQNVVFHGRNMMNAIVKARGGFSPEEISNKTKLVVLITYWRPYADENHPDFRSASTKAAGESRPFLLEGFRFQAKEMLVVGNNDPCPFHRKFGVSSESFQDCCKKVHLKRMAKTNGDVAYMYNPLQQAESERMVEAMQSQSVHPTSHLRLGWMDIQQIRISVPPMHIPVIKERLDKSVLFHASFVDQWIYTGHMPMLVSGHGMMCFGDITLDLRTGILQSSAMTSERATVLIRELSEICDGANVLSASLEANPMHRQKPDMDILEQNRALLQNELCLPVEASIDKKANVTIGKKCAYCGKDGGQKKLSKCSDCKSIYYCTVEHQRKHWKAHRPECRRIVSSKTAKAGAT